MVREQLHSKKNSLPKRTRLFKLGLWGIGIIFGALVVTSEPFKYQLSKKVATVFVFRKHSSIKNVNPEVVDSVKNKIIDSRFGEYLGKENIRRTLEKEHYWEGRVHMASGRNIHFSRTIGIDVNSDEFTLAHEMFHSLFRKRSFDNVVSEMLATMGTMEIYGEKAYNMASSDYQSYASIGLIIKKTVGDDFFWTNASKINGWKVIGKEFDKKSKDVSFSNLNELLSLAKKEEALFYLNDCDNPSFDKLIRFNKIKGTFVQEGEELQQYRFQK